MKKYLAIDSFCGAGGLSYGLHTAGFDVIAAFDFNPAAVETYRLNVSDRVCVANALEITGVDLTKNLPRGHEVDLFAGGPPCQGFSKQKRGAHHGDSRNELVLQYARLVREINPRFFLLENVEQLGGKRGKLFIEKIQRELCDFDLFPEFFNSADFGVAQTRSRYVIVGKRRDILAGYRAPKPRVPRWNTVGDALKGLPEPPDDFSEHPSIPNHYRARVTARNIERFSYVKQGGGWHDIPEHLRIKCHQNVDSKAGGWPDVYGRLDSNLQAPTITGGFDSFTRGRYGHPFSDRPITPREAARLQGFPDKFKFLGTRWDIRHQIGNAVPPPLSAAIGESILRTLKEFEGSIQAESFPLSDVRVVQGLLPLGLR